MDGLYDKSKQKKIVKVVKIIDEKITLLLKIRKIITDLVEYATKLDAAKICMNSGCHMFIANGKKYHPIKNI